MKHKNKKNIKEYPVLNKRNSFFGTLRSAMLEKQFVVNDSRVIERMENDTIYEMNENEKGGLIIFPDNAMNVPTSEWIPQMEDTVDIDSDIILTITAKNKTTGKEKKIRIETYSGLTDSEIERIKNEADNFVNRTKKFYYKWKINFFSSNEMDKAEVMQKIPNWSVGRFLKQMYKAENGDSYTEKSMGIEITGIEVLPLIELAEDLCAEWKQETVLVKSYTENTIFLVKPESIR